MLDMHVLLTETHSDLKEAYRKAKNAADKKLGEYVSLLNETGLYNDFSRSIIMEEEIKTVIINSTLNNNVNFFTKLIVLMQYPTTNTKGDFNLGKYLNNIVHFETIQNKSYPYSLPLLAVRNQYLELLEIFFTIDSFDMHGLQTVSDKNNFFNTLGAAFTILEEAIRDNTSIDLSSNIIKLLIANGVGIGTYLYLDENTSFPANLLDNKDPIIGNYGNTVNVVNKKFIKPINNSIPGFHSAITNTQQLIQAIVSGVISSDSAKIFQKSITLLIERLTLLKEKHEKMSFFDFNKSWETPEELYISIDDLRDIKRSIDSALSKQQQHKLQSFRKYGIFTDLSIVCRNEKEEKVADESPQEAEKQPEQSSYYSCRLQ